MADRIRRAVLRSPKRDPQAEVVYLLEGEEFRRLFYGSRMKRADARKLADQMARWCGVPPVTLKWAHWTKKGNTATQTKDVLTVNLDKAQWVPALLAHEVAHWVCDNKYEKVQDHGPEWLAVYIQILDHYRIVPQCAMKLMCKKYGLRVAKWGT